MKVSAPCGRLVSEFFSLEEIPLVAHMSLHATSETERGLAPLLGLLPDDRWMLLCHDLFTILNSNQTAKTR